MVKKKLALLGASGSIGTSTLDVIREQSDRFVLQMATAHTDWRKLFAIAKEFDCKLLCLTGLDDPIRQKLALEAAPQDCRLYFGEDELMKLLREEDYDLGLNAITGSAGLRSSFEILKSSRSLLLANKESLVMAGHLLIPLSKAQALPILPVDSEHSAIFQAIGAHPSDEIRRLHITASGGSFRDLPLEDFEDITVEQALSHPNWDMGAKVTLDSATMFNKALEVMEAHWLFGLPYERINALIHPQSVVHSLVEFVDGSILAQLSDPDMRLPILYALSYPQRLPSDLVQTDLVKLSNLSFREIDLQRYPLFKLGLEAASEGGIMPTVINAANEAALKLFLERKISFVQISRVVARAMDRYQNVTDPSLEELIETNRRVFRDCLASV